MRPIVINQHYIPRSYLKNFGFLVNAKKRKWSVYAMENGRDKETNYRTSAVKKFNDALITICNLSIDE